MKNIKLLIIAILIPLFLATPMKSRAIGGGASIPFLSQLVGQGVTLGANTMQVLQTVSMMKDEILNVIAIANSLALLYNSSQELIAAADKVIQIYTTYLETIYFVAENSLFLTNDQINFFIVTMDAAAFNLHADDVSRPRGINQVATGALTMLPQLISMMTLQGSNVMDFINLMDNTTSKINTCTRRTKSAGRYCRSVINRIKIGLGIYDIEKAAEDFSSKYID